MSVQSVYTSEERRALLHPSQISTVDSQLDIFTPKQFSTSESLVLTIQKLSFCDFFPQTMQFAIDLLTPSTLYIIIKSNSTKLLARRTTMFYLALAAKWRENAAPVHSSGYSHEKTWSRARATGLKNG